MARQPALALDGLDHRGLLAADVGAGATAQVQRGMDVESGRPELRHLAEQDLADERVLVAEVDVDAFRLHRPRGDEDAFEEPVRVGFEVEAVLERAGLALVRVDRHQPGAFVAAHDAPLAAGGESGAAQTPQPRRVELRGNVLERVLARETGAQQRVAAVALVGIESRGTPG